MRVMFDIYKSKLARTAFFFSDTFSISLNLTIGVSRDHHLRDKIFDIIRSFRIQKEVVWRDRLIACGIAEQDAADVVYLVNTTIRGFAVRGVWDAKKERMKEIETRFKAMIMATLSKS